MGLYNNRIVVKVGTSTLTNDAGKSDLRKGAAGNDGHMFFF